MAIIQMRRGTTVEWTAANPILALGELGLDTTQNLTKRGNGILHWNDLSFIPEGGGATNYSIVASTAIPLNKQYSDMANQTITGAPNFTVALSPAPILDGECRFVLIGDGVSSHAPNLTALGVNINNYAYNTGLGVKNNYRLINTRNGLILYGSTIAVGGNGGGGGGSGSSDVDGGSASTVPSGNIDGGGANG